MIKLTILLLFANGYQSFTHGTYDTINECEMTKQYLEQQIEHSKVVFACLEAK